MELPRYIPIDQASKQYSVSRAALTRAIQTGKMKAVRVSDDTIVVAEEDMKILAIELDQDLVGVSIRATEAAKKYGVNHQNLNRWADAGYIQVVDHRHSYLELDEADVKRVAMIYKKALQETDSPIKAGWILKRTMKYFPKK